jgi:hypothetical protein
MDGECGESLISPQERLPCHGLPALPPFCVKCIITEPLVLVVQSVVWRVLLQITWQAPTRLKIAP